MNKSLNPATFARVTQLLSMRERSKQ